MAAIDTRYVEKPQVSGISKVELIRTYAPEIGPLTGDEAPLVKSGAHMTTRLKGIVSRLVISGIH